MMVFEYVWPRFFFRKIYDNNRTFNYERIGVILRDKDAEIVIEPEADISANLDIVGVNDPLLFKKRSSRLGDLVGEVVVEAISCVFIVVVYGNRGEWPERNSSISEADWVRGRRSTVDSSKKVPFPVKKQNLEGKDEYELGKKRSETCTC